MGLALLGLWRVTSFTPVAGLKIRSWKPCKNPWPKPLLPLTKIFLNLFAWPASKGYIINTFHYTFRRLQMNPKHSRNLFFLFLLAVLTVAGHSPAFAADR